MRKLPLLILIVILVLATVNVAEAANLGDRMLMFGVRGSDVRELQSSLLNLGYSLGSADGHYGQATERAVIRFQQAKGIRIDGIAGFETIRKLKSSNALNYPVRSGDTLIGIARNFSTTVNSLRQTNNLYTDLIYVGQNLRIPKAQDSTVSSQSNNFIFNVTDKEFELLKRAVYSEARGEPYEGQVAVAAVILNRVRDSRFPNTIAEVIFEPWAFTAVHDGQFWLQPQATITNPVQDALRGWDPTDGAVFYYNPAKVTSYWIFSRTVINQIGRHHFAI